MKSLSGRRVVLAVTGSIAAFKAVELTSELVQLGAEVDVVLTQAASRFVGPLTFHSLTQRRVYTDLFDVLPDESSAHVRLGEQAELLAVVPATANTLARLAHGLADDLLGCVALAMTAPVLAAPAMESHMWAHPATQANVAILQERGVTFVGPVSGRLASGQVGLGRLAPPEEILGQMLAHLGRDGPLAGRRIVVTAGGTQEPVDPVRFIGNRSSGKMGYAVATVARDRGAEVTLISGPASIPPPAGVELVHVQTTQEMQSAVVAAVVAADAIIMAAAVADYKPEAADRKLKKTGAGLTIHLTENPDIIAGVPRTLVKVAFAAESEDLLRHAAEKLDRKGADLIVANDITEPGSGFGTDTNRVTLLAPKAAPESLPQLTKEAVAAHILDRVQGMLAAQSAEAAAK
ncbi:MAG: bifunctional phosphopantothenoylcysteine decarboxylase/phosphopantothenate--cysteine ligase CoaBC [Dehalococcoidia bacterium]|nr:bifunctional phosphopantothenoylcysteine decarboxylase/phosphopantothenate--cysteine ligase CoaBC [Dehalococcoidia bacterium]